MACQVAELSPADKMCNISAMSTLCRHLTHVSQDICSALSSGAGRPTLAVENSCALYRGGGGGSSHGFACAPPPPPSRLYNEL